MKQKAKDIAIVILMLLACVIVFCLTSCKTVQPTINTSESKTVTIRQRDTTIIYQGGSVQNTNDLDSIYKYLTSQTAFNQRLNGIQTKVIYHDAQGKVALSFWLDKYNKLQVDCTSKDSMYEALLYDQQTYYERQTLIKPAPEIIRKVPTWSIVVMGILIGIVLALGSLLIFIIKTNK